MKPGINVQRNAATTVSGVPFFYDSGVKYDDTGAYYDRWYPGDVVSNQPEVPKASVSLETIGGEPALEEVGATPMTEKIGAASKQESVSIKDIKEF